MCSIELNALLCWDVLMLTGSVSGYQRVTWSGRGMGAGGSCAGPGVLSTSRHPMQAQHTPTGDCRLFRPLRCAQRHSATFQFSAPVVDEGLLRDLINSGCLCCLALLDSRRAGAKHLSVLATSCWAILFSKHTRRACKSCAARLLVFISAMLAPSPVTDMPLPLVLLSPLPPAAPSSLLPPPPPCCPPGTRSQGTRVKMKSSRSPQALLNPPCLWWQAQAWQEVQQARQQCSP
jgi:hypothetical protein